MRGGGQQQQIGRCFGECRAEFVTGDLFGASAQAVGLVDDDNIPSSTYQVLEAFPVVGGDLLPVPSAPCLHRLNRVQGTNHLVVQLPKIVFLATPLAECRHFSRFHEMEFLAKMQTHFGLPLPHQTFRRNDENPLGKAAKFKFTQNHTRLDGLAQTHFISQQVADTVMAHGPVQGIQLVGQRHDTGLNRRKQQIVFQGINQLGGGGGVQDLPNARQCLIQTGQIRSTGA